MKRFKIKEVHRWLNNLPENKWRKIYKVDAKRVAHFINHGGNVELPVTLRRKYGDTDFVREKKLAKGFLLNKIEEKKRMGGTEVESVNEASMELKKLEDAIKMFQKKIKKQGRVTNARDEDHLKNLIKVYKQMGGKGIKEGYSMRDLGLSPFWKKLNPKQREAISIALVMGGNMTGAVDAIEKIKKGLSKDKKVQNALRLANENVMSIEEVIRKSVRQLVEVEIKKLNRDGILKEISAESRELRLFIDNDAKLYKQRYIPILKNMSKFKKKGRYNSKLAIKAFMYLVDDGAKQYAKDYGGTSKMFSKKDKLEIAKEYAEEFEEQFNNKEFNFMK